MIEAAMENQQPPGVAAMAEDQQKPTKAAATVEDQQKPAKAAATVEDQQKPVEAAASARYPKKEVNEIIAFMSEITASLEADTGVRDGLVGLLVGLGKDGGDARAAKSRVAELLGGHPDVLGRFTAFINRTKAPAVPPGPLAVTRPRRSSTLRNGRGCKPLPAMKEEPDEQDYGSSPRKREAGGAGGRERDDPRVVEAKAFLNQVLTIAGREVCGKLLAVLLDLHAGDQFVDVIYDDAKDALGLPHAALLGEFASTFLPGQKEWEEQVRREARCEAQRNRRRAAAAARRAAAAADDQRPPRADDDDYDGNHPQHGLRVCVESSGGRGTAVRGKFDHQHATLEVVKKRRAADGDHRGHDDENYAPRVRSKKPRADGGGGGGHRRHAVGNNGEPSCSGEASRVPNGECHGYVDKKPRQLAPNGGESSSAAAPPLPPPGTKPSDGNAMFRFHRGLWVFYTRYSTLVETMARVEELLHGGGGGGFPTSMEELFPHREHRELISSYYGDRWVKMRAALEGGDSTGPALEAVLRRLKVREEEAVAAEARERRRKDADRTVERLAGLVADKVRHKERRRRRRRQQDAGDGTRVPGGDRRSSARVVEY